MRVAVRVRGVRGRPGVEQLAARARRGGRVQPWIASGSVSVCADRSARVERGVRVLEDQLHPARAARSWAVAAQRCPRRRAGSSRRRSACSRTTRAPACSCRSPFPDQPERLAAVDREADAGDRLRRAAWRRAARHGRELLDQVLDRERGGHRRLSSSTRMTGGRVIVGDRHQRRPARRRSARDRVPQRGANAAAAGSACGFGGWPGIWNSRSSVAGGPVRGSDASRPARVRVRGS